MATKSTSTTLKDVEIVELQLTLNPRGRSVVHGTLLVKGEMRTVKHELGDAAKHSIGQSILTALNFDSLPV